MGTSSKESTKIENKKYNREKTQLFLNSAISDLAGWIRFSDAKVSVIMTVFGVLIAGIINCREDIWIILGKIKPCSWFGFTLYVIMIIFVIAVIFVYYWGIQTLKPRMGKLDYKSMWFIDSKMSFEEYVKNILSMTDEDVIENMAAELYQLNDINKRKSVAFKHTLTAFTTAILSLGVWLILVLVTVVV